MGTWEPRNENPGMRTWEWEPGNENPGMRTWEWEPGNENWGMRTQEWEPGNENPGMRFLVYMIAHMPQQSSLTRDTATWAHGTPNTPPLQPQASPDHLWYLLFNRDALFSAKGDRPREVEVFIRAGGRVQLLHSKTVGESRRREWHTGRYVCTSLLLPSLPHPQLSWKLGVYRTR